MVGTVIPCTFVDACLPLHETLRQAFEQYVSGAWRVTRVSLTSESSYDATLETRTDEHPDYIFFLLNARVQIEAIEDGPCDARVDGRLIARPRPGVRCELRLHGKNMLLVTEWTVSEPGRRR